MLSLIKNQDFVNQVQTATNEGEDKKPATSDMFRNRKNFRRKRKYKTRIQDSDIKYLREVKEITESETDMCVSLWQSVVVQSLYDLSGKGGTPERRLVRAEASSWLAINSNQEGENDFEIVCDLARLNPHAILRLAKRIKESGVEIHDGFNFRSIRKKSSMRSGKTK